MRNDLYWKIHTSADGTIRWTGYNDDFWWENVATTEHAQSRVGPLSRRIYRIDFTTGLVHVLEPVA